MGNGYPVSAVVTRREIADKLCGNAEYFNTVIFIFLINEWIIKYSESVQYFLK